MPGKDPDGEKGGHLAEEIVWTLRRSRVLWHYWTMPLLPPATQSGLAAHETVSARAFALLLIALLTFAVRGDLPGAKVPFTSLAAGLATVLSLILNLLSRAAQVKVREPALISAYASTIFVMFGYLFVKAFFDGANWYQDWLADYLGPVWAAAISSVVIVYLALWLKAILWDKHAVSARSAGVGLGITVGSGLIVVIIAYLSKDAFDAIIKFICETCAT
jgi:hypothetical protein